MSVPIPARRLARPFSLRWCCTGLSLATLAASAAAPAASATATATATATVAATATAATPPPAAEFAVSPAQMQSLGVRLHTLTQPSAIDGMRYPAQVVVPPNQQQMVSAPVDGVVDRLLVNGQDNVTAGQPLLRLVSPEYGEMQLKVMEAAAKARLSQQTLARERSLFGEGIIPERRVQEAQAAAAGDAARQRQAEAALRLAGADAATLQHAANGGALQDSLTVRARAAGRVLAIDVKPGQRVKQADALVRLASFGELWLDIQWPADRTPPQTGQITVIGRAAVALPLSVAAMVSDNQTLVLRARVSRGAEQLRPGETVQVQVPFDINAAGWALPLQALARNGEQAYVFVRSATGFVATPVAVLSSAGASVQVSGQLATGQAVATASVIALKAAWLGKGGSDK